VPLNLGEVPDYYRRFLDPVDIAILKTCPMDEGGYFNFGPTNMWQRAVVERAKVVIVEINREMPYVFGKENGVHVNEVDFVIEGDHRPCAELPNPDPSEIDRTIATRIAAEIEDGSCLQIGIGGEAMSANEDRSDADDQQDQRYADSFAGKQSLAVAAPLRISEPYSKP